MGDDHDLYCMAQPSHPQGANALRARARAEASASPTAVVCTPTIDMIYVGGRLDQPGRRYANLGHLQHYRRSDDDSLQTVSRVRVAENGRWNGFVGFDGNPGSSHHRGHPRHGTTAVSTRRDNLCPSGEGHVILPRRRLCVVWQPSATPVCSPRRRSRWPSRCGHRSRRCAVSAVTMAGCLPQALPVGAVTTSWYRVNVNHSAYVCRHRPGVHRLHPDYDVEIRRARPYMISVVVRQTLAICPNEREQAPSSRNNYIMGHAAVHQRHLRTGTPTAADRQIVTQLCDDERNPAEAGLPVTQASMWNLRRQRARQLAAPWTGDCVADARTAPFTHTASPWPTMRRQAVDQRCLAVRGTWYRGDVTAGIMTLSAEWARFCCNGGRQLLRGPSRPLTRRAAGHHGPAVHQRYVRPASAADRQIVTQPRGRQHRVGSFCYGYVGNAGRCAAEGIDANGVGLGGLCILRSGKDVPVVTMDSNATLPRPPTSVPATTSGQTA